MDLAASGIWFFKLEYHHLAASHPNSLYDEYERS
jgi:hypothetical protein